MSGSEGLHSSAPYVRAREKGERDAWTEETAARGRRGTQRIVHAREVPAPNDVAALLGSTEGGLVVERRRVICLDEAATEVTDTYYPVHLARGTVLAGTAKIPGGAVTLLAGLGHIGHRVTAEVSAAYPTGPSGSGWA